ncbi:hypothetical protein [Haloprofundus marisrubri]|uniref:hypothetical protein n=1 Tax=Haloprofundus marisrubri TaxID=1514971 RepID=UPI0008F8439C|nr:hypothetical protein [Haloprofundus marisrubri]
MYLSHPVRRMRDDPIDGEVVTLVVELDDEAARESLESTVRDAGGSVERDLQFQAVLVSLPEPCVSSLCTLDGLARIETGETLSLGVDEDSAEVADSADSDTADTDDALDFGASERR